MQIAGINVKSALIAAAVTVLVLRFVPPVRDFAQGK